MPLCSRAFYSFLVCGDVRKKDDAREGARSLPPRVGKLRATCDIPASSPSHQGMCLRECVFPRVETAWHTAHARQTSEPLDSRLCENRFLRVSEQAMSLSLSFFDFLFVHREEREREVGGWEKAQTARYGDVLERSSGRLSRSMNDRIGATWRLTTLDRSIGERNCARINLFSS